MAKHEISDPITSVHICDGFWKTILKRNEQATLPHALNQCKEKGYIDNLKIAAGQLDGDYAGGPDRDSDIFKVMEGAAYTLAQTGNRDLDKQLDHLINLIAAGQEEDGYFNSFISSQKPEERYKDLARSHELYSAGHLIEAAVAHYQATGKKNFLEIAKKLVKHLSDTFGYGKFETTAGHQEIEMALIRLYQATQEKCSLQLAEFFVDMRGNPERVQREYAGKPVIESERHPGRNRPPEYRQDHLPAAEQREAVGHAVRAGYLYAAMADLARECDSQNLANATQAIWDNIVSKKLYLTGGVGTHQYHDEGFGDDYVLPNDGYCETCGGIAMLFFTQRQGQLNADAEYADLIETILFNHLLSAMDQEGCSFHYRNPLYSDGSRKRHPWPNPACCPTNLVRIIPQIGRYIYSHNQENIYIEQFINSQCDIPLASGNVSIQQESNYPWDGKITITLTLEKAENFKLHIRIPGWLKGRPAGGSLYQAEPAQKAAIKINDESVNTDQLKNGYCLIERQWQDQDCLSIDFPMPIQSVYAHEKIEACQSKLALMRGPLVYCLEEADANIDFDEIIINRKWEFISDHQSGFLNDTIAITDSAKHFRAIPYFLWNNRQPGKMQVWNNYQ